MRGNLSRNDGCDHARGYRGQNVIAVDLAPFITVRRGPQMPRPVIDVLAAPPILVTHLRPFLPFVVVHVVVAIMVMVVGESLCVGRNDRDCEQS